MGRRELRLCIFCWACTVLNRHLLFLPRMHDFASITNVQEAVVAQQAARSSLLLSLNEDELGLAALENSF